MAESMHRYAPKPLCFVHLLRSPQLEVGVEVTIIQTRRSR